MDYNSVFHTIISPILYLLEFSEFFLSKRDLKFYTKTTDDKFIIWKRLKTCEKTFGWEFCDSVDGVLGLHLKVSRQILQQNDFRLLEKLYLRFKVQTSITIYIENLSEWLWFLKNKNILIWEKLQSKQEVQRAKINEVFYCSYFLNFSDLFFDW